MSTSCGWEGWRSIDTYQVVGTKRIKSLIFNSVQHIIHGQSFPLYLLCGADILSKFSVMLEGLRKFGDVLIKAFQKVKEVFMAICKRLYLLVFNLKLKTFRSSKALKKGLRSWKTLEKSSCTRDIVFPVLYPGQLGVWNSKLCVFSLVTFAVNFVATRNLYVNWYRVRCRDTVIPAPVKSRAGCKNWPDPFPGRMSYKATKPGLVSVLYLSMRVWYCCLLGPLFMYC